MLILTNKCVCIHVCEFLTLARSRSACLRCLQNRTEDSECGLVTGSPYTNSLIRTPATRTPFSSHTNRVGSIQSIQPHESAAEYTHSISADSVPQSVGVCISSLVKA